jgi:hypothetical protein
MNALDQAIPVARSEAETYYSGVVAFSGRTGPDMEALVQTRMDRRRRHVHAVPWPGEHPGILR